MNRLKSSVFLIIGLMIFVNQVSGQTKIHIPEPFGDSFLESELIHEVTFIPLEIERYGMIASDMEMKVDRDQYFILDDKFTQCVYRFGSDGKFLNNICEQKSATKTSDEPVLSNPAKFNLDPNRKRIEIYNFENSTISRFHYDGKKEGQISFSTTPSDFVRNKKGDYWVYTGWNNSTTQYRLLKLDDKGKTIDRKMRLLSKCTPTEGFAFYTDDDNVYLWELLGNTAYLIKNDEITPRYLFDFGIYSLPLNYHILPGEESFKLINQNGYYTVKKYLENNNFTYFFLNYTSLERREMFHVIHDKRSGQIHVYTENAGIAAFDKAQALTNDDELVFLVAPRKLRQLLSGGTDFVPESFTLLSEELRPLRNPIVLKIKLQSFVDEVPENEHENNEDLYFND